MNELNKIIIISFIVIIILINFIIIIRLIYPEGIEELGKDLNIENNQLKDSLNKPLTTKDYILLKVIFG